MKLEREWEGERKREKGEDFIDKMMYKYVQNIGFNDECLHKI